MKWARENKGAMGNAALGRVQAQLATKSDLSKAIKTKDSSAATDSCNATANVVCDIASNNKVQAVQNIFPMSQNERVERIGRLLRQPNLVEITLSQPDHHFTIIPVGQHRVAVLQAYQGVYDLVEWETRRNGSTPLKQEVMNTLRQLVGPNENQRADAAESLFSFAQYGDSSVNAQIRADFRTGTRKHRMPHGLPTSLTSHFEPFCNTSLAAVPTWSPAHPRLDQFVIP